MRRFEEAGRVGLQEGERPGRPPRLSPQQRGEVDAVLGKALREVGMAGNLWDGKTLALWIERQDGARLGVPQCQTIGIRFTQTASCGGAGGPATPEGA